MLRLDGLEPLPAARAGLWLLGKLILEDLLSCLLRRERAHSCGGGARTDGVLSLSAAPGALWGVANESDI